MKVILIAAVTADGFIAKSRDQLANWTSKSDKQLFVRVTKEAGVMIMGSTTFDTIGRPLPERQTVVYTSKPEKYSDVDVMTTSETPEEILNKLEGLGYSQVTICGGSHIYDLFLQAGFITDIYLTVEPVLFGTGIPLFTSPTDLQLELVSTEKIGENSVSNHYRVTSVA